MSEFFAKILHGSVSLKVASCDDSLMAQNDEVLGDYPILIYKEWFVPRRYIFDFWRQLTPSLDDISSQ